VHCREKAQLAALLRSTRLSVEEPFQRLPTLTAVFLAEAAFALCYPAAAMYPAVNRCLLRCAVLDLQVRSACQDKATPPPQLRNICRFYTAKDCIPGCTGRPTIEATPQQRRTGACSGAALACEVAYCWRELRR
jgi:hypothetical protein